MTQLDNIKIIGNFVLYPIEFAISVIDRFVSVNSFFASFIL